MDTEYEARDENGFIKFVAVVAIVFLIGVIIGNAMGRLGYRKSFDRGRDQGRQDLMKSIVEIVPKMHYMAIPIDGTSLLEIRFKTVTQNDSPVKWQAGHGALTTTESSNFWESVKEMRKRVRQ